MTILILGGTGLVGRAAIQALQSRGGHRIVALVRRTGTLEGVEEVQLDFQDAAAYDRVVAEVAPAVVLCAVGTTIRVAGSPEAFRQVDLDFPARLMGAVARHAPRAVFGLVSSLGADRPRGLYLVVKAQAEAVLAASGLRHVILRPSLLLGARPEFRPGEALAQALSPAFLAVARCFPRSRTLWRFAPIPAAQVGRKLVEATLDAPPTAGGRILEGLDLRG
ncbi:MAG TPA: NAD(P)H-binding protein [Holophagaceae bacterium]|nr:NAD(P)H-binding protein [Holophagaceae bacterium]